MPRDEFRGYITVIMTNSLGYICINCLDATGFFFSFFFFENWVNGEWMRRGSSCIMYTEDEFAVTFNILCFWLGQGQLFYGERRRFLLNLSRNWDLIEFFWSGRALILKLVSSYSVDRILTLHWGKACIKISWNLCIQRFRFIESRKKNIQFETTTNSWGCIT